MSKYKELLLNIEGLQNRIDKLHDEWENATMIPERMRLFNNIKCKKFLLEEYKRELRGLALKGGE